jgi:hypothetical protein
LELYATTIWRSFDCRCKSLRSSSRAPDEQKRHPFRKKKEDFSDTELLSSMPLCFSFQYGLAINAPPLLSIFTWSDANLAQYVHNNPYLLSVQSALNQGRWSVNHCLLDLWIVLCCCSSERCSVYHLMFGYWVRCLSIYEIKTRRQGGKNETPECVLRSHFACKAPDTLEDPLY